MDKFERYANYRPSDEKMGMRRLVEAGIRDIRTLNCALNNGIGCIEDFTKLTEEQVLRWPNFGVVSLKIVGSALAARGLGFDSGDKGDACLAELIAASRKTRAAMVSAGEAHKQALDAIRVRRAQIATP